VVPKFSPVEKAKKVVREKFAQMKIYEPTAD
jgi:hypothetical protein